MILLLAIFLAPWWLVVLFGIALLFVMDRFYEFIIAGFFIDVLYGNKIVSIYHFDLFFFIVAVVLYMFFSRLKVSIRANV
ncbi:MAG: hypothetical protein HZA94_03650 [Candidatus Vogelbacteria bacterium]|nr:hypothetical protein [Candidatus Vogelbacteria bacterium]